MKNLDTVEKLEVFILYVVMHPEKYDVPGDVKLTNLLTHFRKIPEKGAEIFKRPDLTYKMLMGDCDDWTTLVSFIAHKKGLKYKHVYKLKNGSPIHIYPILKIKDNWATFDPWQLNRPFYYKARKDEVEVETCLMMNGVCQRF
jgi:hypothetical protein